MIASYLATTSKTMFGSHSGNLHPSLLLTFCFVHFALLQAAAVAADLRLQCLGLGPKTIQRGPQAICAHKSCMNHGDHVEHLH